MPRDVTAIHHGGLPNEIILTDAHLAFFRRHHINFPRRPTADGGGRYPYGKVLFPSGSPPVLIEPYTSFHRGQYFFPMGAFFYSKSLFSCSLSLGRYCSIAAGVKVMLPPHPMDRLSTCGIDYGRRSTLDVYLETRGRVIAKRKLAPPKPPPVIGHDVWIAENVLLARGITIGNGAVIATGSIVTKDVPDYALVAGIPAVVKRYRFTEIVVERLKASRWWDYDPASFCHLNTLQPEAFLDGLERLAADKAITRYEPPKIDIRTELAALSDAEGL